MRITEHGWGSDGSVSYEVTYGSLAVIVTHSPAGVWRAHDYYVSSWEPGWGKEAIALCKASEASLGYYGVEDVTMSLSLQAMQEVSDAPSWYASLIGSWTLSDDQARRQDLAMLALAKRPQRGSPALRRDMWIIYHTVRELLQLPVIVRDRLLDGLR